MGKITGKILAHFLSEHSDTFQGQSVSLVGYSLGCQVLKSTLNRLNKLNVRNLVHNVYFLAGAVNFEKTQNQLSTFGDTVQGRLVNVYCKNDSALKAYEKFAVKKEPIGLYPQYTATASTKQGKQSGVWLENYDVTHFVEGHGDFRPKMDMILDFIHFDS